MRATRFLSALLCLSLVVGNAASLQLIAWAGMLATRIAEQGFSSAVVSTFDGSRPCTLCKAAAALERADRPLSGDQQPVGKQVVKACDLLTAEPLALECHPAVAVRLDPSDVDDRVAQHRPRPDVPPPRA